MTVSVDFGRGWKCLVDPITVTLTHGGVDQSVPYVLKRDATLEDFADDVAVMESEVTVFHLWADHLGGTVPRKGDKVTTADATVWHVTRVQTLSRNRRFRLTTFKERGP